MPFLLLMISLLTASVSAFAHPLDGLEDCGVMGRRLKVTNSNDPYLGNGDYLLVTSMNLKPCNRWDWIFLVDEELYKRMSQMLKTGTQLILGAPSSIRSEDGEAYELFGMALKAKMGNFSIFQPALDDSRHGLLVTPKTSLYTFFHELRHIGDYLLRGDKIYREIMAVGLSIDEMNASILFILESSAYSEQIRRLRKSTRGMEYSFRGDQAVMIHGPDDRKREALYHQESFREFYSGPMRHLMDSLRSKNLEKHDRLIVTLKSLVSPEDLVELGVHRTFPELTLSIASCEKKLL